MSENPHPSTPPSGEAPQAGGREALARIAAMQAVCRYAIISGAPEGSDIVEWLDGRTLLCPRLVTAADVDAGWSVPTTAGAEGDATWQMLHAINEWADAFYAAKQWVKNLRDGVGTFDEALANLELCGHHAQEEWRKAKEAVAALASTTAGGEERAALGYEHGDFRICDPDPDDDHGAIFLVCPDGFMVDFSNHALPGMDAKRLAWMANVLNSALSPTAPRQDEAGLRETLERIRDGKEVVLTDEDGRRLHGHSVIVDFSPGEASEIARATLLRTPTPAPQQEGDLRNAAIQARGALLLDAMIDDRGQFNGTTISALESLNKALDLCDDEGCPHAAIPHVCVNSETSSTLSRASALQADLREVTGRLIDPEIWAEYDACVCAGTAERWDQYDEERRRSVSLTKASAILAALSPAPQADLRAAEEQMVQIICTEINDSVTADIHFDLSGVERAAEFAARRIAALSLSPSPREEGWRPYLRDDDVEWVVNNLAELGVKIGQQFFFLYKGESLVYRESINEDDGAPMMWRPVFKREFGECCHPINRTDPRMIGTVRLDDSDEWRPLPAPPQEPEGGRAAK